MTVNYIVSLLRNGLNDFSRNKEYTDAYLWSVFLQKRALYFTRKIKKNEKISQLNYQTFCFPLITTTATACATDLDCQIRRTKDKLPTVLTNRNSEILSVKTIKNTPISKMYTNEIELKQFNDIKKDNYSWFIDSGYLYIDGNLKIELVKIEAVWDDITTLSLETLNCKSIFELEYNIDLESLDIIIELCLQKLVPEKNIRIDNTNDSNEVLK